MEKQDILINRIEDLALMAYQRDIVTFTGFLSLHELHMVNSRKYSEIGVLIKTFGGYEFAERQIAAFLPDALSYEWNYPVCCLCIRAKNSKFGEPLTHRDYLGALMHLGIDRSMLGDILVKNNCAYLFCLERMKEFILENLSLVRHTNVQVFPVEQEEEYPSPQFQKITGTVSSLRLDCILALAFRESRSSLVQQIESGNVFVNGRLITSNGYNIREKDIISLRGKGKFQFLKLSKETKKGRLSVTINRYI